MNDNQDSVASGGNSNTYFNVNPNSKPGANTKWEELLGARELQEVHLAQVYARDFSHGTTGHNQLMLIAKLADMLNRAEENGVSIQELFYPK